ncbi:WD40 repeat domain-containing protein [Candidatus Uabimicrobium sp. HlEnr_7]|uniref:WD40 repeat domain-containing protein n=1 Tax=Candidatus Uabimicrobium helgolandensis TaxID=3095367 RepID=UPI0035577D84
MNKHITLAIIIVFIVSSFSWAQRPPKPKILHTIHFDSYDMHSVSFSNDGKHIAVSGNIYQIGIWDAETGEEVKKMSTGAAVREVIYCADGETFVCAKEEKVVAMEIEEDYDALSQFGYSSRAYSAAVNADNIVAIGCDDQVVIWNMETGDSKVVKANDEVVAIAFSADGKTVAFGDDDYVVKICDVATGKVSKLMGGQLKKTYEEPTALAYSPDGTMLAVGTKKAIYIWDIAQKKVVKTLTGHEKNVTSLVFFANNLFLASCAKDGKAAVWSVKSGMSRFAKEVSDKRLYGVAVSADMTKMAATGEDGNVRIWKLKVKK